MRQRRQLGEIHQYQQVVVVMMDPSHETGSVVVTSIWRGFDATHLQISDLGNAIYRMPTTQSSRSTTTMRD
jgi:hypothetical protein